MLGHHPMRQELCPGYFEPDAQEIIEVEGPTFTSYFCALRGQQVKPVKKDGIWVPSIHAASPFIGRLGPVSARLIGTTLGDGSFVRGIFSQRPIQFATGAGRTVTLDQLVDSQEIGLDTHQCHSGERVCDNQLSHAIHPLHQRCETVQRWACGLFSHCVP